MSEASPALRQGGWVGKPVGSKGEVIDPFGDKILCCHEIPGDSWRRRHDSVKMAIYQEACLSKVPVDCEVYGLFGDLLPAQLMEEGGELQWGPVKGRSRTSSSSIKLQLAPGQASRNSR